MTLRLSKSVGTCGRGDFVVFFVGDDDTDSFVGNCDFGSSVGAIVDAGFDFSVNVAISFFSMISSWFFEAEKAEIARKELFSPDFRGRLKD